jgi:hypothetical protein
MPQKNCFYRQELFRAFLGSLTFDDLCKLTDHILSQANYRLRPKIFEDNMISFFL